MPLSGGIVIFCLTWWVVFFMVLPFGLGQAISKTILEPKEAQVLNPHTYGAPNKTQLWKKILVTTLVTSVLWVVFDYLILVKALPLDTLAE